MPVSNGGFELGTLGKPTSWTLATAGADREYVEFAHLPHRVGYEDFNEYWPLDIYAVWHLNEASGTFVEDSSGNERDGTTQNMEDGDWVTGKMNNGLQFGGTDEGVDCGTIAPFERTDKFSLACWFNHDDVSGGYDLLGKWDGSKGYLVFLTSAKRVGVYLKGSTGIIDVASTSTGLVEDWHHLVVTYNGSSTAAGVHIYIDGVDETLLVATDNLTTSILNTSDFQLGDCGSAFNAMEGILDEVRIYDRELTSDEVDDQWNLGNGTEYIPTWSFKTSYSGYYVDLGLAIFEEGTSQEDHEDFEEGWGTFLITVFEGVYASFDTTPEEYEDFEDDWGAYWWTLTSIDWLTFDKSIDPQDFEDFEDGFGIGTQELKLSLGSLDISLAEFETDSVPNEWESFEDSGWTVLSL